jgi:hypothetical protein
MHKADALVTIFERAALFSGAGSQAMGSCCRQGQAASSGKLLPSGQAATSGKLRAPAPVPMMMLGGSAARGQGRCQPRQQQTGVR